jgi:hypothetical protein
VGWTGSKILDLTAWRRSLGGGDGGDKGLRVQMKRKKNVAASERDVA